MFAIMESILLRNVRALLSSLNTSTHCIFLMVLENSCDTIEVMCNVANAKFMQNFVHYYIPITSFGKTADCRTRVRTIFQPFMGVQ